MSKIQNEDIKSVAELTAGGGAASQLPNDDKIYVTANGLNKTLKQAIIDEDIGGGGGGGDAPVALVEDRAEADSEFGSSVLDVLSTGVYSYIQETAVVNGVNTTLYQQFLRSEVVEHNNRVQPGMAIAQDGSILVWGQNSNGQMGDGTTTPRSSPVVQSAGAGFYAGLVAVSGSSSDNNVALNSSGFAFTWGAGSDGQLGNNGTASASSPVSVVGGNTFVQASTTGFNCVALDYLGYAWAWGLGTNGQLGNNAASSQSSPVSIVGGRLFVATAAGYGNGAYALDTSNYAWAWGNGTTGRLGNNSTANASSPVSVVGGIRFQKIVASSLGAVGIDLQGFAWSWGDNSFGQCGDNTTTIRSSPVSVVGGRKFVDIAAGQYTTIALDSFGKVWAWGYNALGQCGDNTTSNRSSPVQVALSKKAVLIGGATSTALAIDYDGFAWAWGNNTFGHCGDSTTDVRSSPVSVVGGRLFTTRKVV
jgi:hypothetical protein